MLCVPVSMLPFQRYRVSLRKKEVKEEKHSFLSFREPTSQCELRPDIGSLNREYLKTVNYLKGFKWRYLDDCN